MSRRPMSAVDHAWYRMDAPTNLIVVNAVLWTHGPLDWDLFRSEFTQSVLDRFPKFTQRPVGSPLPFGRASWEDDPDFEPDRHLIHHRLADPGDRRALEAYVSAQVPVPLDPEHPLWQVHMIDGYGTGSAVLFRVHHSIADGIALTRVLLSLTGSDDEQSGFLPPSPGRAALHQVADVAAGFADQGLRTLRSPGRLLGATTTTVRGVRRLLHVATLPTKPPSALVGPMNGAKQVRWIDDWLLDDIGSITRSAGATVNDVLLSVLADALGRYLVEQGTPLDCVRVMVPVNLRPLDQPLASDLGNAFGEYVVTLPTGPMPALTRLARTHEHIEELKGSPEAVVAYLTLVAMGWLPDPLADLSTRLFTAKIAAAVTNVPGPRTEVTLATTPVTGIIGLMPVAGDVGLTVSMLSYNGRALIGLIADQDLIPDLDRLTDHLSASLADLAGSCAVTLNSS